LLRYNTKLDLAAQADSTTTLSPTTDPQDAGLYDTLSLIDDVSQFGRSEHDARFSLDGPVLAN
jgi:hypothetical protein